jgi:transposase-like protein
MALALTRPTGLGGFQTAFIERYRRRESSVEEALIEMYLAGVSVRRVEDITEALWGTRVQAMFQYDRNPL